MDSRRGIAWVGATLAAALSASGCVVPSYMTPYPASPVVHRRKEEDGRLELTLARVQVNRFGKLYVKVVARTDDYTVQSVRLSANGAPACHSPAADPEWSGHPIPGDKWVLQATFPRRDVTALGVMKEGTGVVEVELVRGAERRCLRVPFVVNPSRTEWAAQHSRIWLGFGYRWWPMWLQSDASMLDVVNEFSATFGVTAGPLILGVDGGVGQAGNIYETVSDNKTHILYSFSGRIAPSLMSHVRRIGRHFGVQGEFAYDLLWARAGQDDKTGYATLGEFLEGPRASVRFMWMPRALHWPGFEEPAYRGGPALEVSSGWWFRRDPFASGWMTSLGFAWQMGAGVLR